MSESMGATPTQQASPAILAGLGSFKIKFDASDSTRSKSLYANGRMEVKVRVLVSGVDADGDVVHVPTEVTTLSNVHDSSVTLEAQTPETYSIGFRRGGAMKNPAIVSGTTI
jgi:hypothetical protein